MTTPTIFSDVAANVGRQQKSRENGATYFEKSVTTVASASAAAVNHGAFRLIPGRRVVSLFIQSDDLDTGTAITVDVGYLYDDTTPAGVTEDDNAFFNGLDIMQDAGSRGWPPDDALIAASEGFVANALGYVTFTLRDSGTGGTTTAGDVHIWGVFQDGEPFPSTT